MCLSLGGNGQDHCAKCKVKRHRVPTPRFWGVRVLNTNKSARTLRLRWLWFEWKGPSKMLVGLGIPCDETYFDFFYISTTISIGNGASAPDSPWVLDWKPKNIAPLIYESSIHKYWKVCEALKDDAWISKIKFTPSFSLSHFRQFIDRLAILCDFQLRKEAKDDIVRKHTNGGTYSAKPAYKAQFHGTIRPPPLWSTWFARFGHHQK